MAKKTTTADKTILATLKEIAKGDNGQIWVRAALESIRRFEGQKDKDALKAYVREYQTAFRADKKSMIKAVGGEATKKLNSFTA